MLSVCCSLRNMGFSMFQCMYGCSGPHPALRARWPQVDVLDAAHHAVREQLHPLVDWTSVVSVDAPLAVPPPEQRTRESGRRSACPAFHHCWHLDSGRYNTETISLQGGAAMQQDTVSGALKPCAPPDLLPQVAVPSLTLEPFVALFPACDDHAFCGARRAMVCAPSDPDCAFDWQGWSARSAWRVFRAIPECLG